jgi:hypothetical protein
VAVTFVAADLSNSGNVTAIAGLNWPAHVAGDVALFGAGMLNTATQTLDALITQLREDVDQNLKGVLGVRLPGAMTGSESGSVDMTVLAGDTNRMVAGIALFRGCSGIGTPTYLAEGGTAVSTHSSPSVSLASANDGILLIYVERQSTSASTITPPVGYIDAGQFGTGGSGGTVMCLAYKVTGNSSGTNNPSTWSSTNAASNCEVYAIPLTAAPTSVTVNPDGIVSGEAWGTPGAVLALTVNPNGIPSGEAWGTPSLTLSLTVGPTGIPSGEAWGVPGVTPTLTVSPVGIASSEAWGTPSVSSSLTVSPTGIPSGGAWGTPGAVLSLQVSPTGIASGESWGTPAVSQTLTVSPTGIPSGEAWGSPTVLGSQSAGPLGIPSAEAWGVPVILLSLAVSPVGIESGEAWGSPVVTGAAAPPQRNITLVGSIEPNRFTGSIEPGRWSASIEPNRLTGVVLWPDQ